jgi:hypothetical protein
MIVWSSGPCEAELTQTQGMPVTLLCIGQLNEGIARLFNYSWLMEPTRE